MRLRLLCRRCSGVAAGDSLQQLLRSGRFQSVMPVSGERHLLRHAAGAPRQFYCGFDPTADSLHVGNLLAAAALLRLRALGHSVIFVVGGATGSVGDPAGKDADRPLAAEGATAANAEAIVGQLRRLVANHGEAAAGGLGSALVLNNADWYGGMPAVEFVSQQMRHLRLHDLLNKHTVQSRLSSQHGISLKEFVYPLFQAYDWAHLYRTYGCRVQVGGNDQTGNIDTGIEFLRRSTGAMGFGLTVPLLTTADGRKLGKSERIADTLWLCPRRTSAFAFYQRLRNTPDADVGRLLRQLTLLPDAEVQRIVDRHAASPNKFYAQRALANSVTGLVHGKAGLAAAQKWTRIVFDKDKQSLLSVTDSDLAGADWLPQVRADWRDGATVGDLLRLLCPALKLHADQLADAAASGRVSLNLGAGSDAGGRLTRDCVLPLCNGTLVKLGRRQFALVRWQ